MSTEHDLTLTQDDDGWDVAECGCGWTGPPCPGTEEAAGFWSDHVTADREAMRLLGACLEQQEPADPRPSTT